MTADLRYPIGPEPAPSALSREMRRAAIADIAALPAGIRRAVAGLNDAQLDTPYRPDGWTVRQVVHHLADSHLNAYLRLKLALTEEKPRIAPYDENAWATLVDSRLPVDLSLSLLDGLHARWVALYEPLAETDFARRAYYHPGLDRVVAIEAQLQTYSWHSRHHVAHVTRLRQRKQW